MTEIWLASLNRGKIKEYEQLFEGFAVSLHCAAEISGYSAPDETEDTFEGNARIKAKSLAAIKTDVWVFSEDSGLEVDGLNKLPGVHSARYAGDNASDAENRHKVLKMLQMRSPHNRTARFKATICLISPDKEEFFFEGAAEGHIAKSESGSEGFGYDSIFIPEGQEQTQAELGLAFKKKVSHRSQAAKKMLLQLVETNSISRI